MTLGAAVAWIGCLFYLAVAPLPPEVPTLEPGSVASFGHFTTNMVLGVLIYLLASGVGFSRIRALAVAVGASVLVGLATETAQLIVPNRSAEVFDVVLDGAGAATGATAALTLDRLHVSRTLMSLVSSGGTAVLSVLVVIAGVAWTPSLPHLEECGEPSRPPQPEAGPSDTGTTGSSFNVGRVTDGLVVLYDFGEGSGGTVHDVSGFGEPLDLLILDKNASVEWLPDTNGVRFVGPGSAIESRGAATKIYDALSTSNSFTLEAWVAPATVEDVGPPSRIVTMSDGTWRHQMNFHLGQDGPAASFRVRTTCDYYSNTKVPGVFDDTGAPRHVVVTYDGAVKRLYVDGAARGPATALEGDFSNWDRDYPLVLGNEATMTRSFLGRVFLVALYDHVLTQQEIQSSFRAGPLVRPTPPNK